MPEQRLDDANIDALLEQMSGEAVAERARRQALVDLSRCLCRMAVAIRLRAVMCLTGS